MSRPPIERLSRPPSRLASEARVYLRPLGLLRSDAARRALDDGSGRRLAGEAVAFTACDVLLREGARVSGVVVRPAELEAWAGTLPETQRGRIAELLARIAAPREGPGGTALDAPLLMGIVNATPDSFSEGGATFAPEAAIAHGLALRDRGAAILDIGGESTRPGARPVDPEEELHRVEPVLAGLAECGLPLSIDTRKAAVMRAALGKGARILNDVSALTDDPASLDVAAGSDAAVVLTHKRGAPETMNRDPVYAAWAPLEVFDHLEARIAACGAAGIGRDRLIADPGIAFGKRGPHNRAILGALSLFHGLGVPLLVGISRKGLSAEHERTWSPPARLPGSLAASLQALDQGVQILRVHDMAETRQAIAVWRAIAEAG